MFNRDNDLDRDNEIDLESRDDEGERDTAADTGSILGISRVSPGATGEIKRVPRKDEMKSAGGDDRRVTPLER